MPTVEPGFITGIVHGQAPPTFPMAVYAVDDMTGEWAFVETPHTDGPAPYTLEVLPGSYRVFACPLEGNSCALGYSEDGWTLTMVTVATGQTIADIPVRPPSQSECGSTFGLPASPDGRFAAVAGPTEECRAAALAAMPYDDADEQHLLYEFLPDHALWTTWENFQKPGMRPNHRVWCQSSTL